MVRTLALSCACVLGWAGAIEAAAAAPAVRLVVEGDCPSAEQMRAALSSWVDLVEDPGQADWEIAVEQGRSGTTLAIRGQDGERDVRAIESEDCQAVASAFAVVVHAHFVELHLLPEPELAPESELAPEPEPAPPPTAPERPEPPTVAAASNAAPGEYLAVAAGAPRGPATAPRLSLGVAGGVVVTGGPTQVSEVGEVAGAARLASSWMVRAGLALWSPATQESEGDRVEARSVAARAGLAMRVERGRLFGEPGAAVGVVFHRVRALDLAGTPRRSRVHPVALAGAAGGVRLGGGFAARAELAGTLFLLADRYLIEPDGVVARSPRAGVSVLVGLEWSTR